MLNTVREPSSPNQSPAPVEMHPVDTADVRVDNNKSNKGNAADESQSSGANGFSNSSMPGTATKAPTVNAPTQTSQEDVKAVETKLDVTGLDLWYGSKQALKGITTPLPANSITALIGPSGCGKSTFLRCLNRMNDLIENVRIEGEVLLDGQSIYGKNVDVVELRRHVGMVFQKPNPFPMSIWDNIAYGPRLHGIKNRKQLDEIVETSLRGAALWDEVKDELRKSALAISGGQQQRLCIARTLATKPQVLLMDEPCSALDPISTLKVEELMRELKEEYTIIIVTHNMQQAARVSDKTGFFLLGELIETDDTSKIFTDPGDKRTEDYITGRFG